MTLKSWFRRFLNRLTVPQDVGAERVRYIFKPIAGVAVTEDEALRYSAVWSCVRAIAEPIATFPWMVMVRNGTRRERLENHPADWLLHTAANPEMTAYGFRETLLAHCLTWGNGYAEIERDGSGRPINLWPIEPDRVKPDRDDAGALWYEVNNGKGGKSVIAARDMFHVKGLGFDGIVGYSPIQMAKQSISLGLACEQFGAAFFGNGAMPGGVIEAPAEAQLSVDAKRLLLEQFNSVHRGPANFGKVALLDGGMGFKSLSVPPETAQFLETRKFQIADVARWYRVPLHKLYELDRATYNNIETQQIEFLTETLIPWMTRLEQEANAKLLGPYQRGRLYTKLRPESLLRGDIKTRYEAYAIGRQWGWLSINDVRALEDLNPIPEGGDEYLTPLNMREAGSEIEEPGETEAPEAPESEAPETEAPNSPEEVEIEDRFMRLMELSRQHPPTINLHMREAGPIHVEPHVHIHEGEHSVDVHVDGSDTTVHTPAVNVAPAAVTVEAAPAPEVTVHVAPAEVTIQPTAIQIDAPITVEPAAAPPITVNVAAPEITTPTIQIDAPITVEAAPTPEVTVHVAPAEVSVAGPIVTVEPAAAPMTEITIRNEQAPPLVDFRPTIEVAPSPAPDVHVLNESPVINVTTPTRGTIERTIAEFDENGMPIKVIEREIKP